MNHSNLKYQPSIALVFGYLPNIDRQARDAGKNGLNHRFSIALDSYHPESGEIYFDVNLFETIFSLVAPHIRHDRVDMAYPGKEQYRFQDFQEGLPTILKKAAADNDIFDHLWMYEGETMVCFIETERYVSAGGPAPYHDTYNFAVYNQTLDSDLVRDLVVEASKQQGFAIRAIEYGLPQPKRSIISWIKKLF